MEQQKKTAEEELDDAVKILPRLIDELRQIENNNTLTRMMAFQREKTLIDRLPPKQQNLLKAAGSIFAPAYQQNRRKPCGPGPFRPGPYGLGLFIPGNPGQFWQDLFGPGSLGPSCGFRNPAPSSVFGPTEIRYGFRPPPYGWNI
ncbi:unnamed protein product [Cylicocyclus nassatus]|uniref:Uncharacterized protein n=1 Tax=Cylicocyclus nassatus TaxID=53992 RepID=A0AA36MBU7_CYLNA|nr:unnamed protein product [Cylicocyclus nassatus]